jgi:hypothetical protein
MKALTTKELNDALYSNDITSRVFRGVHPACIEPKTVKEYYSFITNTHTHEKSGEHWNSWIVDKDTVFFFDSFGRGPTNQTLPFFYSDFVSKFKYVVSIRSPVQGLYSNACGYFCAHYIYLVLAGFTTQHFLNDYTRDFEKNDKIVSSIFYSIFN